MNDRLARALADTPIPDASEARERTKTIATAGAETPIGRRWVRRTPVLVAAILALLVASSFTPPGRAVADDLGQLVGIGEEPSDPGFAEGNGPSESEVIGLGTSPNGTDFELAATTNKPADHPSNATTCLYVSFPNPGVRTNGEECMTHEALGDIQGHNAIRAFPLVGPPLLGEDGDLLVEITARRSVAGVDVTYPGPDGKEAREATLAPFEAAPSLSPQRQGEDATPTPLQFGVAFLPTTPYRALPQLGRDAEQSSYPSDFSLDPEQVDRILDRVHVTAYDDAGKRIEDVVLGAPSTAALAIASEADFGHPADPGS